MVVFYPEACLPALSLFAKAKNCNSSNFYYRLSNANGYARLSICDFFCREIRTYKYLEGLNTEAKVYLDCDMALRLTRAVFNLHFGRMIFICRQITIYQHFLQT